MRVTLNKEEVENIVLEYVNRRVAVTEGFDRAYISAGYYQTEFCVVTSRDPEANVATLTTGGDDAAQ